MTTSTKSERPVKVFSVIVEEKAELEDGIKLSLNGEAFKSTYPVLIFRVPARDAAALKVKGAYNLKLREGNLKKAAEGKQPFSGALPWHYYWDWVGIATEGEDTDGLFPDEKPHVTSEVPNPKPQDYPASRNDQRVSIESQKALDLAVQANAAWLQYGKVPPETYAEFTGQIEALHAHFRRLIAENMEGQHGTA